MDGICVFELHSVLVLDGRQEGDSGRKQRQRIYAFSTCSATY